ncbi:MAG: hypothetical protein KIS77_06935 [Saprospiraceae bacterium]|nr:hypothetical protein [Saprospiraceae bacterium]
MRRILRKIAEGETSNLSDISTLLNPEVVEEIKNGVARLSKILVEGCPEKGIALKKVAHRIASGYATNLKKKRKFNWPKHLPFCP